MATTSPTTPATPTVGYFTQDQPNQISSDPATPTKPETVNHPAHYGGDTTYEAIKVIEAWKLGFHLGNVVKYICRSPHSGTQLEDLKKARWYLDRKIQNLEKTK